MAAIHDAYTELSAIAALCCEATGEERGTRSALECAREALALARRYDARKLLRCPECGSTVVECRLYYGRHEMLCAACGLIDSGDTFDAAADKWREP